MSLTTSQLNEVLRLRGTGATFKYISNGNYPLAVGTPTRYSGHFEQVYSKGGIPFYCWKRDMPSISDDVLDCVIYLYPSDDEAEQGVETGGTGFLVGMSPDDQALAGYQHLYAVTNQHVVGENEECPSPVIRLNTRDNKHDVYPLDCDGWIPHTEGADLAVHYFGLVRYGSFHYQPITAQKFIKEHDVESGRIRLGQDIFMAGRFFLQQGIQRNTPSVRFGNISMMPWEPVAHPTLGDQESFLVEMRTISGYSGSPVFTYEQYPVEEEVEPIQRGTHTLRIRRRSKHHTTFWNIKFLGIDWGHIPFQEPVQRQVVNNGQVEYEKTDLVVPMPSGPSGVIPAWVLYNFLYSKGFDEMRKDAEKTRKENLKISGKKQSRFVLDVKKPEERPFNRGTFEDALRRASRKVEPESKDSETSE